MRPLDQRRHRWSSVATAGLAALVAAAACQASPGPPDLGPDAVVFSSPHFRLHARAGDQSVCQDTTTALEEHLQALSGEGRLGGGPSGVVDYYKLPSAAAVQALGTCAPGATACAPGETVISNEPVDRHELVHAYLASLGTPPALFVEGVAKVFSCDPRPLTPAREAVVRAFTAADLARWPTGTPDLHERYIAASWLVRELIDRFGMEKLRVLYASTPATGDPARIDGALRSAYGVSLEHAWEQARAAMRPGGPCLRPDACSSPGTATISDWIVKHRCGIPDEHRPLQVAGGPIRVSLRGGGALRLGSCDGHGATPDRLVGGFIGEGGGTLVTVLAPQRYFLQHTGTPLVSTATVSAEPLGPVVARGPCDAAVPAIDVPAQPAEFQVAVPADGERWWARLTLTRPAQVSRALAADRLWICSACAAAPDASCREIGAEPDQTAIPAGDHVMWLRGHPDPQRFALAAFRSDPGS